MIVISPVYFHGNHNRQREHNNTIQIEQILSYKTLFFSTANTISYAFLPAMHKSLHATLSKNLHGHLKCGLPFTLLAPLLKRSEALINVSEGHCFHMEEFSSTPLLYPRFHVRHHSVRMPLCCHLLHSNNTPRNAGGKVQPLLPSQQPPLTLWADIIKQEALLSEQPSHSFFVSQGKKKKNLKWPSHPNCKTYYLQVVPEFKDKNLKVY